PVPFFDGPMLTNPWLKEYNALVMIGLTNAMRHSDNNLALTITKAFAQKVWQYFREIKIRLATELLGIAPADAADDTKALPTDPPFPGYQPDKIIVNMEDLENPGMIFTGPTADDLQPFFAGIPANLIVPNLVQYPVGPIPGGEGM